MATMHTMWADAVVRGDRRAALDVWASHGMMPDERVTDFFMSDLKRSADIRKHMGGGHFRDACRFDSADPVVGVTGWGIAENYFILSKKVNLIPFMPTPLLEFLPIVGPEEYPPMADRYILQMAQTGLGEDQAMSGQDLDFPLFESVTTPMEAKGELRGGKVMVTWVQQQRGMLPNAVNLDKAATDLMGLQKRLGELRPERNIHEGNPDRGTYGLVNHPGIEVVTPSTLTYGTTNMQDWGTTEAAIRDIANTIVSYLQSQKTRALGISGYVPDTMLVPNWLDTISGRIVYGQAAGGNTYPIKPMKQYILDQCPWIKNWVMSPLLDSVNNTTRRLAISSNGIPDPATRSSRLFSIRASRESLHFGQPIAYQQLPPWMKGPAQIETAAYHQDLGMLVLLEAPNSSLIC